MGAEISKTALTPEEKAWALQKAHDDIHGTAAAAAPPQRVNAASLPRNDSVIAVDGRRPPERQPSGQTSLSVVREAQRDDGAEGLLRQERLEHDQSVKAQSEKERLDNDRSVKSRLAAGRGKQVRLNVSCPNKEAANDPVKQERDRHPGFPSHQQTNSQMIRDKENAEKHRLRIERTKKERLEREAAEAAKRTPTRQPHAGDENAMWQQTKATSQANAAALHKKKLGEQAAVLEAEAEKNRRALQEREKARREKEQQKVAGPPVETTEEGNNKRSLSVAGSLRGDKGTAMGEQSLPTRTQRPQSIANSSKRPATEPVGRIPKRSRLSISSASPVSPMSSGSADGQRQPPDWYKALKRENSRNSDESGADTMMKSLKDKIARCKSGNTNDADFNAVRRCLHGLVFQKVHGKLLRNNMMLHNEDGLPQLFDVRYSNGVDYPFDIRADAEELYNKWSRQIFETDLLRGIIAKGGAAGADRNADSIDPKWPTVSARYHGNGKLLNGQWWPTQLTTFRDGAHGVTQGGICGATGHGAYSCILSGGQDYADEDHGDWLLYCGTDSKTGEPTDYTKHMIESVSSGLPVRLLRSHNCHSQWAPQHGFRYDGLYDVVSMERLDPPGSLRQRHRFRLERRLNQDPIRGGQGPATRPTQQEVEAYTKGQRFRGIGVKGKKGTVFPTFG
ncbi:uncharacterized protein MYCGRDRAFT_92250 [Zymoseptoria tritici IPO323]|uniref:YDG domain-containing protein n=1 Tax=Zymoseptoria tritici (strain CBS 115943 / IPO323) TaxID=336722 RepID=F9X9Y2_ZYMTI|nr:uncharacterized protein MYCGRDRAFT_92250 [Zymoseptoria tritici IPO323]EGP87780.1 hypothetical protein MYCGRDRAFT_92250 [Zymoseptoria tritici IPO323]